MKRRGQSIDDANERGQDICEKAVAWSAMKSDEDRRRGQEKARQSNVSGIAEEAAGEVVAIDPFRPFA